METKENQKTDFLTGKYSYHLSLDDEEWNANENGIYTRRKKQIFLNGNLIAEIQKDDGPLYPLWLPHKNGVLLHENSTIYLENKLEKRKQLLYMGVKDGWLPADNGLFIIVDGSHHYNGTTIRQFYENGKSRNLLNSKDVGRIDKHPQGIAFENNRKIILHNTSNETTDWSTPMFSWKLNDEKPQHWYGHKDGVVVVCDYHICKLINQSTNLERIIYDGAWVCYVVVADGIYIQKDNFEIRFFS